MTRAQKLILPSLVDFSHSVNDLENKPAPELTLLSMAYLDTALKLAISSRIECSPAVSHKIFDAPNAALSNLSSKIHMAAGLKLIDDDIWTELQHLRSVRDHFAHAFHRADWDEPHVIKLVDKLKVDNFYKRTRGVSGPLETGSTINDRQGGVIDLARNDLIVDTNNRIGFFCYAHPSDSVVEPAKRRYLESYWTCLFMLMGEVIQPWLDEMDVQSPVES